MKRSILKKDPKERTADEKGMLNAFNNPVDFTNRKKVQPLVDYCRKVSSNEKKVN